MLNSTYCKLFWYRPPKEDLHYRGSIFGDCLTRSKHWKSRDYWEKGSHCYLCYLRFSESCRTRFWAYQPETCHFITLSCITAWNNWSVGFCLEAVGWWHLNLKLWFSKSLMCHRIIVLFRIIAPSLRFFVEFMTKKSTTYPGPRGFYWLFIACMSELRRERKTSGHFGLQSHFHHPDASCQTLAITCLLAANVSMIHSAGEEWYLLTHLGGVNVRVCAREYFHPQRSRRFCLLNILRSKYLYFTLCKKASGLLNRKA